MRPLFYGHVSNSKVPCPICDHKEFEIVCEHSKHNVKTAHGQGRPWRNTIYVRCSTCGHELISVMAPLRNANTYKQQLDLVEKDGETAILALAKLLETTKDGEDEELPNA